MSKTTENIKIRYTENVKELVDKSMKFKNDTFNETTNKENNLA